MAKNGYPVLNHLICPRFKGTQMMLQEGRDSFQAVYDVTIGYKPIAKHIFWRFPAEVHVHIERLPIDSVPIGDGSDGGESVKEWLLQRWVKKDALLERFRVRNDPIEPSFAACSIWYFSQKKKLPEACVSK